MDSELEKQVQELEERLARVERELVDERAISARRRRREMLSRIGLLVLVGVRICSWE